MQEKFVSKEVFFREVLVPTTTLAEVLLKVIPAPSQALLLRSGKSLDSLMLSPLSRVAHYVLNAHERTDLRVLQNAVLEIRQYLGNFLKALSGDPEITGNLGRFFPIQPMDAQLTVFAKKIHSLLIEAPSTDAAATDQYPNGPSREALGESMELLRLFAQNLEPETVFKKLNLPQYLEAAKSLSTESGYREAHQLWLDCFPAARKENTTFGGAPMPANVAVVMLPSGFLEVTAILDPKRSLKWADTSLTSLPESLTKKLAVRRKVLHCSYRLLAETVDACEAWLKTQHADIPGLQAEYDACVELKATDRLMDKLKSQFSAEEIAMLERQMRRQGSFATA